MPGATGLEVAQQLGAAQPRPHVVFVTAYDQYAIDAFDAGAADYLLKPVDVERLGRTVDRLRAALQTQAPAPDLSALLAQFAQRAAATPQYLRWIRASRRSRDGELTEQIPIAEVLYIQADDKYTCVITRQGEALIRVPATACMLTITERWICWNSCGSSCPARSDSATRISASPWRVITQVYLSSAWM